MVRPPFHPCGFVPMGRPALGEQPRRGIVLILDRNAATQLCCLVEKFTVLRSLQTFYDKQGTLTMNNSELLCSAAKITLQKISCKTLQNNYRTLVRHISIPESELSPQIDAPESASHKRMRQQYQDKVRSTHNPHIRQACTVLYF